MKKVKKSKLKFGRIVIFLLAILFCIFLCIRFCMSVAYVDLENSVGQAFASISNVVSGEPQYKPIYEDTNEKYAGKRKRKSNSEKIGYSTTFTTIDKNKKVYIEYKQNGNSSWSQKEYWDNNMETSRMWYNCNVYHIKWVW